MSLEKSNDVWIIATIVIAVTLGFLFGMDFGADRTSKMIAAGQ